jgi:signal transduction histidine kinase/CheY-like chemotaxis protein
MIGDEREQEQVLVLAPHGRDAALAVQLLTRSGLSAVECASMLDLAGALADAGCAILTEEALSKDGLAVLVNGLALQPAWSDFPFILLASKSATGRDTIGAWHTLGNVTLLDRPTQSRTLVSAVGAALRARRRQYEVKEAIARRDQFLAMLGHELRNPLAAIALAVESDPQGRGGPGQRQREIIARQTQHLSRLVDDLLDVARVTTGKVVLHRAPVDINEVLGRCIESVQLSAASRSIRVEQSIWPAPLCVLGDTVRLEEVFNNLLCNAIKYSPPHSRVLASTRMDGDRCSVQITDFGVGIAPDMLPRVFDLFAQGEVSLDRRQAGLGIGLTLVKSLVELHEGSVTAGSQGPGSGSCFSVSLPLTGSGAASVPAPDSTALPNGLPVLIVDDNPDLLEMTKEVLESFGCEVQTASDGFAGLAQLNSFQPALALIDIGLPGRDGYSLATEVRAGPARQPWLVALTGYGQPDDQRRALAAGFDRHLTKPVSIAALREAIQDANRAWLPRKLA